MVLEAQSIEKWYFRGKGGSNRFFAVNKTDLKLEPGKITVLTGRSGSGKTTLMHMMAGVLTPDAGRVKAYMQSASDGERKAQEIDLYAMDDDALSLFRNIHMALIPQGGDVFRDLTVMENILLPLGIYKSAHRKNVKIPDMEEHAGVLLEKLEIDKLASVPAGELSGGERRRVCVARALCPRPDVIFADEPTSDLDDESMDMVLRLLRGAADNGAAVFIVTHDAEALDYADISIRMNAGSIEEGSSS